MQNRSEQAKLKGIKHQISMDISLQDAIGCKLYYYICQSNNAEIINLSLFKPWSRFLW